MTKNEQKVGKTSGSNIHRFFTTLSLSNNHHCQRERTLQWNTCFFHLFVCRLDNTCHTFICFSQENRKTA